MVSVQGATQEEVLRALGERGWQAKPARRLPEDQIQWGLLMLFAFLLLLLVAYIVADVLWGVSETLFGIIAGSGTQASTMQQGAAAYRETRLAYAQTGYAASAPPPPSGG